MNQTVVSVAAVVVAFLVGAIPFGVLVSRAFYDTDIRNAGSGNIGAANALRTLGKRGAIAVLALDALKGFAPTLAAGMLGGTLAATLAAVASVVGHCWSPFLGGKGGKGVATFFGALFALWWPAGLAFMLVWVAIVIGCGFASVASMLASAAMGFVLWYGLGREGLVCGVVSALLVIYRHRENLERLRTGTENRLSLLKAGSTR
ncbi:MAG: glycerol-3-phosphate 1-O-acyltransferase PlsY [Candidatus Eremiobacteraeota bacterium]|nr:glycerol-3-phosphate 1-O-acyltransferase PlsY [Candidatus Eremiobacteraeota bacterium]